MITVESRVAQRRIEKLAEELKYVSTETFLRGLGLKAQGERALSFLQNVFPSSSKGSGRPSSVNEFGMPLEKGFYAESFASGTKIGFFIGNRLASNSRAATVLEVLDKGNKSAFTITFTDPVHFLAAAAHGGKSKGKAALLWFTLTGTHEYTQRLGSDYTERTEFFIKNFILTEVKEDFNYKVQRRMARVRN